MSGELHAQTSEAAPIGRRRAVLVTGAAQGLGRGIALAFASAGYDVAIVDVKAGLIDEATEELRSRGAEAVGMVGDVSVREDVERFVADAVDRLGRVDVLVNNAQGGGAPTSILETSVEKAELTWRSGFMGTLHCMQVTYPHLVATSGSVINVVSGAALSATPNYSIYASTKAAIRTLTRVAAVEWGPVGIRVNAISPSAATPALMAWAEQNPQEYAKRVSDIPLGRLGDAERDIGAVAVFLAAPAASYITGDTIVADGGVHYLR